MIPLWSLEQANVLCLSTHGDPHTSINGPTSAAMDLGLLSGNLVTVQPALIDLYLQKLLAEQLALHDQAFQNS